MFKKSVNKDPINMTERELQEAQVRLLSSINENFNWLNNWVAVFILISVLFMILSAIGFI